MFLPCFPLGGHVDVFLRELEKWYFSMCPLVLPNSCWLHYCEIQNPHVIVSLFQARTRTSLGIPTPTPTAFASCPEGTSFPFPLPTKLPLWPPARKLQSNNRNWKNLRPSPRTVSQRKAYISWLVLHDSLQGRTKCLRVLTSPSFHWRLVFNCRHRRLWELCRRWSWFMLVQAIFFKN